MVGGLIVKAGFETPLWDKLRSLQLVLKAGAIVIPGGMKGWRSAERKPARAPQNAGHHVIFQESE